MNILRAGDKLPVQSFFQKWRGHFITLPTVSRGAFIIFVIL